MLPAAPFEIKAVLAGVIGQLPEETGIARLGGDIRELDTLSVVDEGPVKKLERRKAEGLQAVTIDPDFESPAGAPYPGIFVRAHRAFSLRVLVFSAAGLAVRGDLGVQVLADGADPFSAGLGFRPAQAESNDKIEETNVPDADEEADEVQVPFLSRRDREKVELKRGKGCINCRNTGYWGRSGVFEVLTITPPVKKQISQKVDSDAIKKKASEDGMTTLRENAIKKMLKGTTTYQEVLRITAED